MDSGKIEAIIVGGPYVILTQKLTFIGNIKGMQWYVQLFLIANALYQTELKVPFPW